MKLEELNEETKDIEFNGISKDLSSHIDKLEADIKEVNLNVVKLLVNKTNKVLETLSDIIKSDIPLLELDEKVRKYTKQLKFFKDRYTNVIAQYKDNEFKKDIMDDVEKILKALISKIDSLVGAAGDAVDAKTKEVADSVSTKKNKGRKVPVGTAQDIDTRKLHVEK